MNNSATEGESNFKKVAYRQIANKACNVPCCVAETQELQDCPTLDCEAPGNQPWFLDPTKCEAQIKRYKNQKESFPDAKPLHKTYWPKITSIKVRVKTSLKRIKVCKCSTSTTVDKCTVGGKDYKKVFFIILANTIISQSYF